ncbi:MAG: class 1 fructose-bisphosphatase [Planctomycetes bacterium]|nr:class 1 fructose-bisphosphatase [Planctomycetota bacterium]
MAKYLSHPTLADQFFRDQGSARGSGELSTILNRVTLAGRMIANAVLRAGLEGKLGRTGDVNVQGEEVKKLDAISNEIFEEVFDGIPVVAGLASEEREEVHVYARDATRGKYVLLHDPLDGSGNLDVNGSVGTIFSIYRRLDPEQPATLADFLRRGSEQVAAGYLLYGPATLFVYTCGGPVHGFTLDRSVGAFFLTHPQIQIPSGGGTYAVNEANERLWDERTRAVVRTFREGRTVCGRRGARYVGALVADFHRTLMQGGIYMYPGEVERPAGKLRLLYEAAPLALIARQAGGHASDGSRAILDVAATSLHQRTPLFLGARADVAEAERLLWAERPD